MNANQVATTNGREGGELVPAPELTPMMMLDRAVASGASVETLAQLMALQERWEGNQARKAFDDAMAAAKSEIPVIFKNRTVDFTSAKGRTHYKHEDFAEIARTVDPILAKHGLSYRFRTSSAPNEPVTVTCIISHRLGHSEENTLQGPRDDTGNKNSLQQISSSVTYLQRYTLKAALGLAASEDDDGKGAGIGETISEEQIAAIQRAIIDTGSDIPAFLDHFKIEKIDDLPANAFKRAMRVFEMKAQKAAKK